MKLTDIVHRGAVVAPLKGRERDQVVGELVDALASQGGLEAGTRDQVLLRVIERELKSTTGFGKGVAVPHAKDPRVTRVEAALGISPQGVEFNSLDRQPVYIVMLLISPEDQPNEHLRAMEAIFKHVDSDVFRRLLRQCQTPEEAWALLQETDARKYAG